NLVDVQTPQPNAVAWLHGHQRISSISVPLMARGGATAPANPDRAKWCEDALGPRLMVAKTTQDALDDPGRANDLETDCRQGNEAGNHHHSLLKVRVWAFQAEGAGQDQDKR